MGCGSCGCSTSCWVMLCLQVESREDRRTAPELKMKLWEFTPTHQRFVKHLHNHFLVTEVHKLVEGQPLDLI